VSKPPPLGGAVSALLLLHVLALLAAATRLAARTGHDLHLRVAIRGFVPPAASTLVAAALLAAYAVAVALRPLRPRAAWWYGAALAAGGLAFALSDHRDWLPNALVLAVLALPASRRELSR
jgi:hypothetical protein